MVEFLTWWKQGNIYSADKGFSQDHMNTEVENYFKALVETCNTMVGKTIPTLETDGTLQEAPRASSRSTARSGTALGIPNGLEEGQDHGGGIANSQRVLPEGLGTTQMGGLAGSAPAQNVHGGGENRGGRR